MKKNGMKKNGREKMEGLIYLASPYSHPTEELRRWRYERARDVTARLMSLGFRVFSPIAYSHELALSGAMGGGSWEHWEEFDVDMIERCDEFAILPIKGWQTSAGIRAEVQVARERGMIVHMLTLDQQGELPEQVEFLPYSECF